MILNDRACSSPLGRITCGARTARPATVSYGWTSIFDRLSTLLVGELCWGFR